MRRIEVRGLHKSYAGKEVLKGINLDIRQGEVLGIIGPNGAGKSTLLRIINLIEEPTSGKINFEGKDTSGLGEDSLMQTRRKIGAVLQNPVLFSGSVGYNVGYGLRLRGIEDGKAVLDALKKVGLEGFEERKVHELSGGECQRVALARAIAFRPSLLLLDEPTAGVDNENARLIERAIAGLKTTVVLSTHNLFQAKRVADRTAFMDCGRILECAKTGRLFRTPENERMLEFIRGDAVF